MAETYVSHKGEGLYPGADPTAPGGMSQKALMEELVRCHGWSEAEADDYRDLSDWSELIEQVCQERLNREAEMKSKPGKRDGSSDLDLPQPDDSADDSMEADLAEMREAYEKAKAEQRALSLLRVDPDSADFVFDGHAGAGPSGSHRWMTCTASLRASRKFLETLTPNQQREFAKSSRAARQGTTAHAVGEIEAHVALGQIDRAEADAALMELSIMPEDGVEYDEEMADYVSEYTSLIETYISERGAENVLIEARVSAVIPLSGLHEGDVHEVTGSADMAVLPTDEHTDLVIGDLKYGNGIDVTVDGNPQIRHYALGVLDSLTDEDGNLPVPIETLTYYIIQPRLGGIKVWTESINDLLDWRDDVLSPALTAALYPDESATFTPEEDACHFCPARGGCAALAEDRMEKAAGLFDAIAEAEFNGEEFPETVPLLEDQRLSELLTQIKGVVKIYDDLKAEAQRRLYRGGSLPGWQLVNYSPPRAWAPEAIEALDPDLFDEDKFDLSTVSLLWRRSMLSPTQALLALKKAGVDEAVIEDLITHPDKRPVLAPEGDRRKTWEGRAPEDMFADESETGEV